MKLLVTILFLLASLTSNCQKIPGKKSDVYSLFDSINVKSGDTIHLSMGMGRLGDFISVFQQPGFLGKSESSLPRNFANTTAIIKYFKTTNDQYTGKKTIAVVKPGTFDNYIVDLEQGIKLGEIKGINSRVIKP